MVSKALDFQNQVVSQDSQILAREDIASRVNTKEYPHPGLVPATTREGILITIKEGVHAREPSQAASFRQQIWASGLPWYLYEEAGSLDRVFSRAWLVEYGRAGEEGEPTAPSDPIDFSPLIDHRALESPLTPKATNEESHEADHEPWTGCWWPFADKPELANLFDREASDTWRPMVKYDAYFRPGQTDAWNWESLNHRRVDVPRCWEGHCDAWSAASVIDQKPTINRPPFNQGEQEDLLAECWTWYTFDYVHPPGASFQDNTPMTPGDAWKALRDNIRDLRRPVVFDIHSSATGHDQVWNHPVYLYTVTYENQGGNLYSGPITILYENDTNTPTTPLSDSLARRYEFRDLEMNGGAPVPRTGVWTSSTVPGIYPDVAWYPNPASSGAKNPNLNCSNVRGMIYLEPPRDLRLTPGSSSIRLDWRDASSNAHPEDGSEVERKVGSAPTDTWLSIAKLGPNKTTYTDNAGPGRNCYRVRAYSSADGNSLYSGAACGCLGNHLSGKSLEAPTVAGCGGLVSITEPATGSTVQGGSPVTVKVAAPVDAKEVRLEVKKDGQLVTTLHDASFIWEFTWTPPASPSSVRYTLQAVATLADDTPEESPEISVTVRGTTGSSRLSFLDPNENQGVVFVGRIRNVLVAASGTTGVKLTITPPDGGAGGPMKLTQAGSGLWMWEGWQPKTAGTNYLLVAEEASPGTGNAQVWVKVVDPNGPQILAPASASMMTFGKKVQVVVVSPWDASDIRLKVSRGGTVLQDLSPERKYADLTHGVWDFAWITRERAGFST